MSSIGRNRLYIYHIEFAPMEQPSSDCNKRTAGKRELNTMSHASSGATHQIIVYDPIHVVVIDVVAELGRGGWLHLRQA
ncbi:hypothetical protein J6590_039139 [Homalodisca vitripennis]|nr:hypothetical protein J6590_039139 [Homalodisca vitripennis]